LALLEAAAIDYPLFPAGKQVGRTAIDLIKRGNLDPVVEVLAGAHAGVFG